MAQEAPGPVHRQEGRSHWKEKQKMKGDMGWRTLLGVPLAKSHYTEGFAESFSAAETLGQAQSYINLAEAELI